MKKNRNKLINICLTIILFINMDVVFAGWTSTPAKIRLLNPNDSTSAWIVLESSVASQDTLSCGNGYWFLLTDLDTDKGKANWSLAMLAFAMGHKVTINSTQCVNTNYNNVYRVRVDAEDN